MSLSASVHFVERQVVEIWEVKDTTDKMLKELHDIRMLLMLLLYKFGATQTEIANALGIKQASVGEMMTTSDIKTAKIDVPTSK